MVTISRTPDRELESLYNPQLVCEYLEVIKSGGRVSQPKESPAIHNTNILTSIADIGVFSVDDIVQLLAVRSV